MPAHLLQSEKNSRSYSLALSDRSSKKSKSLLTKLNIMQSKKDNYDYVEKIYNTVSKIFVGGNNFVWAVKGPYIFTLKYDPFNGG
jgi:predicted ribosome-associated RNA-binding protein Tma20